MEAAFISLLPSSAIKGAGMAECSDIAINFCVIVLYRSCLIKSMPGGPQLCLAYPPRQFLFVKNDVLYVICTVCSRLQLRGMLS